MSAAEEEDCVYFHGIVHPRAEVTSKGINYSLESLRKCCKDLPGTELRDYHDGRPAGSVVHSYVGDEDRKLHAIAKVSGDGLEVTMMQKMIEAGLLNALSLQQLGRIDGETAEFTPVGKPVNVGVVHVSDAGRGSDCVIDSHARWSEIKRLMTAPKSVADILPPAASSEGTAVDAKKNLAALVWKLVQERNSQMSTTTATTPAAAAAAATPAPAAAAPVPGTATAQPPAAVPKEQDLAQALKEMTAAAMQTQTANTGLLAKLDAVAKEKAELEAKLKAATPGRAAAPSKMEQAKVALAGTREHFQKMFMGKEAEMPESIKRFMAEIPKYEAMSEAELASKHQDIEVMCAASAAGAEYAKLLQERVAESKALRDENDRYKSTIFGEYTDTKRVIDAAKRDLAARGMDFSTKIDTEAPPAKRQMIEAPAPVAPTAAVAPVAAPAAAAAPLEQSLFTADPSLWEYVLKKR